LPSRGSESGTPELTRNTPMIEPPKATKGRRMSKKSRKKSPKAAPKRKVAAKSSKGSKTAAPKARPQAASTSNKKGSAGTSHKAASKRLKSPSRPAAAAARNKSSSVEKTHTPAEGAKAPSFNLPRDGGGNIALSDFAGKKLVLFFYPRADTPGCTREAIDFTRLKGAFAEAGTEVLGISADSLSAQERFRDKHELGVALISDEKHQMLEAYGAWGEKSMYGRTFLGILRTTVLIGADGSIARVWRHVKVDGHADAVLEAAQGL
jgi:peroxiredoxin Q/BCP